MWLGLTNPGELAQPEHSWYNISFSSLLLTCFTWFCTELLVFKADEFGLSATAKHLNCVRWFWKE